MQINYFIMWLIEHNSMNSMNILAPFMSYNKTSWLPREKVVYLFVEASKTWLDNDLCNLVWPHSWHCFEKDAGLETSRAPLHTKSV